AAERILHRHHDRGRHLVRRRAGQLKPDAHGGRIGLRKEVDAETPEREDAQHDQRRDEHRREYGSSHAKFGQHGYSAWRFVETFIPSARLSTSVIATTSPAATPPRTSLR